MIARYAMKQYTGSTVTDSVTLGSAYFGKPNFNYKKYSYFLGASAGDTVVANKPSWMPAVDSVTGKTTSVLNIL